MKMAYQTLFSDQMDERGRKYIVLPDREEPRIILPLSSRRNFRIGIEVHNTASPVNRVKARAIKESYPVIRMFTKNITYGTSELALLTDYITNLLKLKAPIEFSGFCGTQSKNSKLTLQIISSTQEILGYLKIADTPHAKQFVQNEQIAIEYLNSLHGLAFIVPKVVHSIEWSEWYLLLETSISLHTTKIGYELSNKITDALISLANKTAICGHSERYLDQLAARFFQFANEYSIGDEIIKATERSICKLKAKPFPLVLNHGDYVSYNMRKRGKILSVFDWEFARLEGLPFSDLFHFIFQGSYHIHRRDPKKIIERHILGDKNSRHQLSRYASAVCVDGEVIPDFLFLYLVESILFDVNNRPDQFFGNNHFLQGLESIINNPR